MKEELSLLSLDESKPLVGQLLDRTVRHFTNLLARRNPSARGPRVVQCRGQATEALERAPTVGSKMIQTWINYRRAGGLRHAAPSKGRVKKSTGGCRHSTSFDGSPGHRQSVSRRLRVPYAALYPSGSASPTATNSPEHPPTRLTDCNDEPNPARRCDSRSSATKRRSARRRLPRPDHSRSRIRRTQGAGLVRPGQVSEGGLAA